MTSERSTATKKNRHCSSLSYPTVLSPHKCCTFVLYSWYLTNFGRHVMAKSNTSLTYDTRQLVTYFQTSCFLWLHSEHKSTGKGDTLYCAVSILTIVLSRRKALAWTQLTLSTGLSTQAVLLSFLCDISFTQVRLFRNYITNEREFFTNCLSEIKSCAKASDLDVWKTNDCKTRISHNPA